MEKLTLPEFRDPYMSWPPVTKNAPFKEVETAASLLADVIAKDKFQDPFSYLGKKVQQIFSAH